MKRLRTTTPWFRALFSRKPNPLHSAAMSELLENETRRSVLLTLLRGTTVMTGLFVALLFVSIFVSGNTFVWLRAVIGSVALAYLVIAHIAMHRSRQRLAAYMLVAFYVVAANVSVAAWGVGEPFALLMMMVSVVLAGFLLGAKFSLYVAILESTTLIVIQRLISNDAVFWPHGELKVALLGDIIGHSILFMVVGLVTWLFGRQVEQSLRRAWQAERDLQQERDQLEVKLQERTESLRELQLKEMKQLYHFAELGQMSTALLHDLANRLTALTLDIEELGGHGRPDAVERARTSIAHLDELVDKVRTQLHQSQPSTRFNALRSVHEVQANVRPWLVKSGVKLRVQSEGNPAQLQILGDALRFGQVLSVLVGNAIDAAADAEQPCVEVTVTGADNRIEILVKDWGSGISKQDRTQIFKPFHTTKSDGMGVGLFIARELIETHFKGSITLEHAAQPTTFKIIVPRKGEGHDTPLRGGEKTPQ